MVQRHFILAIPVALLLTAVASAQVSTDIPRDLRLQTHYNLGDITSDGSGGRQIQIRPMTAEDIGRQWKFFPPYHYFREYGSPLATPAQDAIVLTAGTPLTLVLPQLQHFPMFATVSVSHALDGHEIEVDAALETSLISTATIYGPHEYLHPLGALDAGDYRLNLNFTSSLDWEWSIPTTSTGYVEFVVVPEPSTLVLAIASAKILLLGSSGRPRRRR
jgi:hypothetical protein